MTGSVTQFNQKPHSPPDIERDAMDRPRDGDEPVDGALKTLSELIQRISVAKWNVVFLTSANLLLMFLVPLLSQVTGRVENLFLALSGPTLMAGALLAVFRCEQLRVEGDTYFQEISDELEWHVSDRVQAVSKSAFSNEKYNERPDLAARLVLRSYSKVARMPLVPGPYGLALYAALNLLVGALTFLFLLPMIRAFN